MSEAAVLERARVAAGGAPLLDVHDLSVEFATRAGTVRALDRVSVRVAAGEVVGMVGESGSGKSVTALAAMGLLDPAARVTRGAILFGGRDVLGLAPRERRATRGGGMGMVFQSPRAALNPIRPVGKQVADALRARGMGRREAAARAVELLAEVRIPDPAARAAAYPFELSGGMCQRVLIAIALAGDPRLLIADEPTTGLDATVQAAVLSLILGLVRGRGMGCLFITHDLLLASQVCDRVAVMHAGQVVETAPAATLFRVPRHPYSARLLATAPRPEGSIASLVPIPGGLPDLRSSDLPDCRYYGRCERAGEDCVAGPVPVVDGARCWRPL